jgi:uridine kinase
MGQRGETVGRRILIDGRSGSGKTELARALVADWPGAQLVRLDEVYPGWHGLAAASTLVPHLLTADSFPTWDWAAHEPGPRRTVAPSRPLVVEGVGAISRASRPLADYAIWVELPDAARKRRALARDGDVYAPHWDEWAAQEDEFIERERPQHLADVVVDGTHAAGWRVLLDPARVIG